MKNIQQVTKEDAAFEKIMKTIISINHQKHVKAAKTMISNFKHFKNNSRQSFLMGALFLKNEML